MSTLNFPVMTLRQPPEFTGNINRQKPITLHPRRRQLTLPLASNSPQPAEQKPIIELQFIGPKAGGDGRYPVDEVTEVSGEKVLRKIMEDNKLELYATYGKLMNCGGGGSCGTCIVEVIDGKDLLSERTNAELKYLKKKPESWRLACQTIVGNKENCGKVVIQRLPQWKK
ncbi:hypothetical protein ACET3Z_007751 [Daucus carota]